MTLVKLTDDIYVNPSCVWSVVQTELREVTLWGDFGSYRIEGYATNLVAKLKGGKEASES